MLATSAGFLNFYHHALDCETRTVVIQRLSLKVANFMTRIHFAKDWMTIKCWFLPRKLNELLNKQQDEQLQISQLYLLTLSLPLACRLVLCLCNVLLLCNAFMLLKPWWPFKTTLLTLIGLEVCCIPTSLLWPCIILISRAVLLPYHIFLIESKDDDSVAKIEIPVDRVSRIYIVCRCW